ncbi:type II secretion system F family protein [Phytohabitans flavus]|uniref:Type II secretion system protein n=1 Tax=Phytohabitans flavus TaxID=1076124 RepID=A0A6F8XYN7_9ACTN|nr:type II secretion system F family protein [Phytohabitans flavus]BCB78838.1 type II secretion system protein [Phytohabitans flavus]
MDPLLAAGLGAFFLALAVASLTVAFGASRRPGVAQALVDIDRVYAPGAQAGAPLLGDRALRPVVRALTGLGRRLTPKSAAAWMHKGLDLAGNPAGWSPERIFEMQGLGFVTLGFLGGLAGLVLGAMGVVGLVPGAVVGVLAGALIGLLLPYVVVFDLGQRRQQKVRDLLPDALDMLTLSVEAGLNFDAALAHVATGTRGPLSREISRALHEMQMGKQRSEALRALADRTTVRELRTVAIAVVQATELGVPISSVLREQANEMRVRRRQRAEEQARKVPVKVLFPLIFCLFPALFIVVIGPGILRIMDTLVR